MQGLQLKPEEESFNGLTVYRVVWDHGLCGCGACSLTSTLAFFVRKEDAEDYIKLMSPKVQNALETLRQIPGR